MLQSIVDENKRSNQFQSWLLILAMSALMGLIGYLLLGKWGFIGGVILLIAGMSFSPQASAALVVRMYKAEIIRRRTAPQLFDMFSALCNRAELDELPKLYYIPSRMPNAFAFGSGAQAGVAVTDGLLRMLTPREMAGVLAHEISHISHGDVRVMVMADIITRTTSMFSRFGIFIMLFALFDALSGTASLKMVGLGILLWAAPTISVLLQLALSRTREFNADQGAAELTGDPQALASALKKLQRLVPDSMLKRVLRPGQHRKEPAMLRTHPPTEERVAKLLELMASLPSAVEQAPQSPRRIQLENKSKVRRVPRYHFISGLWH